MNNLVAIIHPDEWNQYIPFNSYLATIKQNYDRIICVVPENAALLMSEADEYYTVKNTLMEYSYPKILDTSLRTNDAFVNKCVERIVKDFSGHTLNYVSWQQTKYHKGVIANLTNIDIYKLSFQYAQGWYGSGKLIYPTEDTYNRIKEKYSHIINDNTFSLISRNFKNKALIHNTDTMIPNFVNVIRFLTENGVRIINIGFPPVSCLANNNYFEINEPLTQDELVSIFYLTKGALLPACSSGFLAHFASNIDVFILTAQWGPGITRSDSLKTTDLTRYLKTIHNVNNNDNPEAILELLTNHVPTHKIIFSKNKHITYV